MCIDKCAKNAPTRLKKKIRFYLGVNTSSLYNLVQGLINVIFS